MIWPQNTQFFSAPAAGWTKKYSFSSVSEPTLQFPICNLLLAFPQSYRWETQNAFRKGGCSTQLLILQWYQRVMLLVKRNGLQKGRFYWVQICSWVLAILQWDQRAMFLVKRNFLQLGRLVYREVEWFCNGINALCSSWNENFLQKGRLFYSVVSFGDSAMVSTRYAPRKNDLISSLPRRAARRKIHFRNLVFLHKYSPGTTPKRRKNKEKSGKKLKIFWAFGRDLTKTRGGIFYKGGNFL